MPLPQVIVIPLMLASPAGHTDSKAEEDEQHEQTTIHFSNL